MGKLTPLQKQGQKSLQVHTYDGQLKEQYLKLVDWDQKHLPAPPSFEQCMTELKTYLEETLTGKQLQGGQKMHDLLSQDTKNNYDKSNEISFEDIMPRVWRFYRWIEEPEDKFVFIQQFLDIQRGTCPQGRAGARMYQLYFLWIDDLQRLWSQKEEEVKQEQELAEMMEEDEELGEKLEEELEEELEDQLEDQLDNQLNDEAVEPNPEASECSEEESPASPTTLQTVWEALEKLMNQDPDPMISSTE